MSEALHDSILVAHQRGGAAELSRLYSQAAELRAAEGAAAAASFYLTHAYVFALEAGLDGSAIHSKLKQEGREE